MRSKRVNLWMGAAMAVSCFSAVARAQSKTYAYAGCQWRLRIDSRPPKPDGPTDDLCWSGTCSAAALRSMVRRSNGSGFDSVTFRESGYFSLNRLVTAKYESVEK